MSDMDYRDYDRESRRDQQAENSARQGWAFESASTTGAGTMTFKKAINFGLSFYEKPFMHYGYEVIHFDPDEVAYPSSMGFVYEWVQNEIEDYVGAYVGVIVTAPTSTGTPFDHPQIEHHFTFTAKAWKDVGNTGGEDLPEDTSPV